MKKTIIYFSVLTLATTALAEGNAWRVSVGGGMRFGIDSSFRLKPGVTQRAMGASTHPSFAAAYNAASGQTTPGRYEFGNGFIQETKNGGALVDTRTWLLEDAAQNFVGNTMTFSTTYEEQSLSGGQMTLGGCDDYTAQVSVEFARTLWQNDRFGLDLSLGFSWFHDVDILKSSGQLGGRQMGTLTGTVNMPNQLGPGSLDVNPNPDGSAGDGDSPTTFSPVIDVDDFIDFLGSLSATPTTSSAFNMNIRGEMSMLEAQLALQPYVRVWDRLYLHGKVGVAMIATEVSINGSLSENGHTIWRDKDETHDITFAGILGLSATYYFTDNFFVQGGVEMLLGADDVDVESEFVKGKVGVGDFGCTLALGVAF